MDAGTAVVIASVVAASGSAAAAWISGRHRRETRGDHNMVAGLVGGLYDRIAGLATEIHGRIDSFEHENKADHERIKRYIGLNGEEDDDDLRT